RVHALGLPGAEATRWRQILAALFDARDGLSADDLAVVCRELTPEDPLEGGLRVMATLQRMVDARLITAGQTFTAFVAHGVADSSGRRLARWTSWEEVVLEELDAHGSADGSVYLRALSERLSTAEATCTPNDAAMLLRSWSTAAQGQRPGVTPVRFRQRRGDVGRLDLEVDLRELRGWLRTRQAVADEVLSALVDLADGTGRQVHVASELEHLVAVVEDDLWLRGRLVSVPDAVRAAIGWMHDIRVITVDNGLAVFRSAMRLDRSPSWPGLRGREARETTEALRRHQLHRILRVHVMDAWARTWLTDPERAEHLRADWFALPLDAFQERWFPGERERLARPTTAESYRSIVTDLGDPHQEALVTRDVRRNHLVLAGPGSGKTRILVHRVAWLLRCQRVRAGQILVVCYTRANALELRRRLHALVGRDAARVTIRTLHGVALSLIGPQALHELDLDACLREATARLRGESVADEAEQSRQRDALLRGFGWLFVDEYQDIDATQYALLSAIAGRAMQGDQRRLKVFAVGDDDQAIFGWDGASTDFIRSFESDYRAARHVLPVSYRNPAAVLDLAQRLVRPLPGRLKADTVLEVDPARRTEPPAGPWAEHHPELRGQIVWHVAGSVPEAARALMAVVRRWLDDGIPAPAIGVLARTRREGLHRLRLAAEAGGVPFSWALPSGAAVPVGRIREVVAIHDLLDGEADLVSATRLEDAIADLGTGPWARALASWLAPHLGRRLHRERWRRDLIGWARLERRARTLGEGVHLGTMHSVKGLELDHVLLLDDGTLRDRDEDRRLLYVALTRARRSLQIFSGPSPSGAFRALEHPLLQRRQVPPLAADAPPDHGYGLLGPADLWLDWLGRQDPGHPGHTAWERARHGDPFLVERRGEGGVVVDGAGVVVAALSAAGARAWLPRLDHGLRLRLLAVT
ncbi:MAG: ATP-dependent helicase, partial [Myxococcales bacterium]|nr:ATP-dependent helicase [Myxococcales bacterium]